MKESRNPPRIVGASLEQFEISDGSFSADLVEGGLATGAFAGHRWFVRDLVSWLRPASIVELGSELGCSYSAFAEGVIKSNLTDDCEVFCVDLWKGFEEHGFVSSDDSFGRFQRVTEHYDSVRTTVRRMSFDEAAGIHTDSIDLLLIDGVHSYEATQNDFQRWKHLLSDRSIVLFHDVAAGFGNGSSDFWSEIKGEFPSLEFSHSYGLGVLFFGTSFHGAMQDLALPERMDWYEYRWRAELAEIQIRDHMAMIDERDSAIASMTAMIDDRDSAIASMTAMIDDRDASIAEQKDLIQRLQRSSNQTSPPNVDGK